MHDKHSFNMCFVHKVMLHLQQRRTTLLSLLLLAKYTFSLTSSTHMAQRFLDC